MRKIPTIFERDWNGDRSRVVNQWHPDCFWVRDGEGVATQKIDGTCCMIRTGALYRRREVKAGGDAPVGFEVVSFDAETGKTIGWVLVGDSPEDARHREALDSLTHRLDGTYELIGPKVQGNPEQASAHILVPHASKSLVLDDQPPRTFGELELWLMGKHMEGLVFHHPDGRMGKIKLRDFGIKRPAQDDAHG